MNNLSHVVASLSCNQNYITHGADTFLLIGGPGYLLNKAGIKTLVTEAIPQCRYKHTGSSAEDFYVARCLDRAGVWPLYTAHEDGE